MKQVVNIVFKLNNHTWNKVQNNFWYKKNNPSLTGFHLWKKAPSPWKNIFKLKKCSPGLFAHIKSWKRCADSFFKRNGSRDDFDDCRIPTIILYNDIIYKTRKKKDQENSALCSADNYLTNDLIKFLQDRIKP